MSENNNLPAVAHSDIALDAAGAGNITAALQNLVSGLQHRAEAFDDINLSLHVEEKPDGSSRSVFSFRAYKHHRR